MPSIVNRSLFRRSSLAVAVLAASMGPLSISSAQAQLEEVIVTAQKRAQSANDVGITINTFTGDQIRDFGVFTAEDIAQRTPGLTVNETAATGVPLYTIRGVGFQDYSTAASSTVGIYFDEVAMPYTVMTRGLVFDTARVEVLKGPQGRPVWPQYHRGSDQLHQQQAERGVRGGCDRQLRQLSSL